MVLDCSVKNENLKYVEGAKRARKNCVILTSRKHLKIPWFLIFKFHDFSMHGFFFSHLPCFPGSPELVGTLIKVGIEPRHHCRDITEQLLKATLNQNKQTKFTNSCKSIRIHCLSIHLKNITIIISQLCCAFIFSFALLYYLKIRVLLFSCCDTFLLLLTISDKYTMHIQLH